MTPTALETARAYVVVDTAIGGTNHRNHPMAFGDFHYPPTAADVFATWMRFDGGLLEHFKVTRNPAGNNTVAGYRGVCWAPRAPIDVDRPDLAEALADTRRLVSWLVSTWDIPAESLVIIFSGSKGFHVEPLAGLFGGFEPSADLPARVGRLIVRLLEGSGLTVDTAVYEPLRLWREPNTKHGKTGLFAIPLTVDELQTLTIDDIRGLAIAPRKIARLPDDEWQARSELVDLWRETAKSTVTVIEPTPTAEPLEGKIKAGEGRRHKALVSMAGTLRYRGLAADEITAMLLTFNETKLDPPRAEEEVREIAAWVTGFPVDGVPFDDQLWTRMKDPASTGGSTGPVTPSSDPVLVVFNEVTPEAVQWLWPGRIPLGKLTLIDGDPGLGKSVVTIDTAARVTRGIAWPDGEAAPETGRVVFVSAEDDLADTILPRFLAAGGDPSRAVMFMGMHEKGRDGVVRLQTLNLQTHADVLEDVIRATVATYVIIDPLTAYLGRADSKTDAEVRGVLTPLSAIASRTRAAVVAVMHLNKKFGGPAIYRPGGSIGFIGAARMAHLVTRDPDDPTSTRRLFLALKENVAAPAAGLAYRLEPTTIQTDSHILIPTVRATWEPGTVTVTAGQALDATSDTNTSALDEAKEFLREALNDGPVAAPEVERQARQSGIRPKTLQRARELLGIQPKRQGFGKDGGWFWGLPKQTSVGETPSAPHQPDEHPKMANSPIDSHDSRHRNMTSFGQNGHLWPDSLFDKGPLEDERTAARLTSENAANGMSTSGYRSPVVGDLVHAYTLAGDLVTETPHRVTDISDYKGTLLWVTIEGMATRYLAQQVKVIEGASRGTS